MVEAAGIEPASANHPLTDLHAYPDHFFDLIEPKGRITLSDLLTKVE